MKIVIIDNNLHDLEETSQMIQIFMKDHNYDIEIMKYNLPNDFIESKEEVDLIILESKYELDKDGIDAGRVIKENRVETKIIYLTHSDENISFGYKVHAERYILKPISQQEFNKELLDIIKEYGLAGKTIKDIRLKNKQINVNNIVYIESMGRKTLIFDRHKQYEECYIPMFDWQHKLADEKFIKTHRSYLVNLTKSHKKSPTSKVAR